MSDRPYIRSDVPLENPKSDVSHCSQRSDRRSQVPYTYCIIGTYPGLADRGLTRLPLVVVTMSIHKLTAGSGYDYLTRQIAALDATEKGHLGLASYYTERGETPGAWIGSGLAGIDGLNVGDAVTAEQMRALFGAGMHPLATQRLEQLAAADLTDTHVKAATRLGAPFKVYAGEVSPFRVEVAKRIAERHWRPDSPRTSLSLRHSGAGPHRGCTGVLPKQLGREPIDAREIAATIAKQSRPRTQTVAGYDLTFSPVKSVSTLWAVADPHSLHRSSERTRLRCRMR